MWLIILSILPLCIMDNKLHSDQVHLEPQYLLLYMDHLPSHLAFHAYLMCHQCSLPCLITFDVFKLAFYITPMGSITMLFHYLGFCCYIIKHCTCLMDIMGQGLLNLNGGANITRTICNPTSGSNLIIQQWSSIPISIHGWCNKCIMEHILPL